MMRRKKQKSRIGKLIVLVFFVAVALFGMRYHDTLAQYWNMIMLIAERKDARSLALSLRHEPLGIFCVTPSLDAAEECYLFDMNGVVFDRARTVVSEVIVRVDEQSDIRPVINTVFVPSVDWQNLRLILEAVRNKKVMVSRIALQRADKELILTMLPYGTPFYFSYAFNPRVHLDALPEFLKKVSLTELRYVDFRIEGKIFYR